jgi:hypothetical protein
MVAADSTAASTFSIALRILELATLARRTA